jgi:gas vesicle protein
MFVEADSTTWWTRMRSFISPRPRSATEKMYDAYLDMRLAASDVAEATRRAGKEAKDRVQSTGQAAMDKAGEWQQGAQEWAEGTWQGTKDKAGTLKDKLKEGADKAREGADKAKDRAGEAYQGAKDEAQCLAHDTKEGAQCLYDKAKRGTEYVADEASYRARDLRDEWRRPGDGQWKHGLLGSHDSMMMPHTLSGGQGRWGAVFPSAGMFYSSLILVVLGLTAIQARRLRGREVVMTDEADRTLIQPILHTSGKGRRADVKDQDHHPEVDAPAVAGAERHTVSMTTMELGRDLLAPGPALVAGMPLACLLLFALESLTDFSRLGLHAAFLTLLSGVLLQTGAQAMMIKCAPEVQHGVPVESLLTAASLAALGETGVLATAAAVGLVSALCAIGTFF